MTQQYLPAPGNQTHVWEVTKVEDAFGPASLGGSNRMKRVTFRMADGSDSYVDVPLANGWPAQAAALIEQMVADHIDASQLKSVETI